MNFDTLTDKQLSVSWHIAQYDVHSAYRYCVNAIKWMNESRTNRVDIYNRKTRRAADKHFAELVKDGWGEWEEIPPIRWHKSPIPPITGLYKFMKNNIYSVQFVQTKTEWGNLTRLLIRRHDQKTTVSWAHKQRIKNELVGEEATAVEVFPPESRLFDEANIYHLWVIPSSVKLPLVL